MINYGALQAGTKFHDGSGRLPPMSAKNVVSNCC